MTAAELKGLQSRIAKAQAVLELAKAEQREAQRKTEHCRAQVARLTAELAAAESAEAGVVVTEHAMLRYVDRVFGLSLDEIRRRVLPESVEALVKSMGNGVYPVDGFRVKVRDGHVVTVLVKDEEEKP